MMLKKNHYISTNKLIFLLTLFSNILKKYIYGFCITTNRLYIVSHLSALAELITFLKYSSLGVDSLLDIAVVDNLTKTHRYELNYIFINYTYQYRLILKLYTAGHKPLNSINGLFAAAT